MRAERWLDVLPVGLAAWVGGTVLWALLRRMTYPFDLEWMEGGMLAHAWRLQRGLPLYVEPNPDFIPFIYPPGYPALLAAAGSVAGVDYALGRALSVTGTLAAAAAIVWVAERHGKSLVAGLVGAACYLGCFRGAGGFLDLVRPDAVAVGLMAWSLVLAVEARRGAEVASGLLLCAAFLVKHNLALLGVPLVVALWLGRGTATAGRFALASALPALAVTAMVQWRSDGRFLTWLLGVPRSHPMFWDRLYLGAPGELARWELPALAACIAVLFMASTAPRAVVVAVGAVLALGAGAVGWVTPTIKGVPMAPPGATAIAMGLLAFGAAVVAVQTVSGRRASGRWWLAAAVGGTTIVMVGLMRAHFGGFMNVLMPAHWAVAAGMALAVGWARHRFDTPVTWGVTTLVMVGQLGFMARELELEPVVPTDEDVEAGRALVAYMGEHCDGPILSPHFAWLPTRLGQAPSMHLIALWDINHEGGPYRDEVGVVSAAARDHHWVCVLEGQQQRIGYGVEPHYHSLGRINGIASRLAPKTGWRVRPIELLVAEQGEK